MEIQAWQKELMATLVEKGLCREDILSVMLVLSREEPANRMLTFLRQKDHLTADEICEVAGKIAFES